jgi:hypothetical protein
MTHDGTAIGDGVSHVAERALLEGVDVRHVCTMAEGGGPRVPPTRDSVKLTSTPDGVIDA